MRGAFGPCRPFGCKLDDLKAETEKVIKAPAEIEMATVVV
jgi:hypothetical protein